MKRYKIAFAAGSRADYGIVRNFISLLDKDDEIDFSLLLTGALLDPKYGNELDVIYDDGFKIDAQIPLHLCVSKVSDTTNAMAEALSAFGVYFEVHKYDLLIILGDRYEMLSVTIAAAMQRMRILHLHGGEITLGNYDEFIRHSITKMSNSHITSTEEYRKRAIQLGENPDNVACLGALGAENCLEINETNVPDAVKTAPKGFTVLFHPETMTATSALEQTNVLLSAIDRFIESYHFYFIGTNADTKSDDIRNTIKSYCKSHKNTCYVDNLHPDAYHYLVKNSYALLGNSSSGIIEAPSLGTYTINIGDRQKGRVRGKSVIDVPCRTDVIAKAMDKVISNPLKEIDSPYYKADAAKQYYLFTKKILSDIKENNIKEFWDVAF